MHDCFALLDDATADSRLYTHHAGTLECVDPSGWPDLLARMQTALARGLYAVPVLTYELGARLLGIDAHAIDAPLAQVLLFERCDQLNAAEVSAWLAADATQSTDLFLRHKTSVRTRYDAAWRDAEEKGCFDTLFFNERGELTEGGRSNVLVRMDGQWITPALACGVLPGVMRAVLMEQWNAREGVITRAMLETAQEIVVCNALRGPLRVRLLA
jgi:branched-subunit amino acid aminotransferase/4-amino-4-deoxychorismate lyase